MENSLFLPYRPTDRLNYLAGSSGPKRKRMRISFKRKTPDHDDTKVIKDKEKDKEKEKEKKICTQPTAHQTVSADMKELYNLPDFIVSVLPCVDKLTATYGGLMVAHFGASILEVASGQVIDTFESHPIRLTKTYPFIHDNVTCDYHLEETERKKSETPYSDTDTGGGEFKRFMDKIIQEDQVRPSSSFQWLFQSYEHAKLFEDFMIEYKYPRLTEFFLPLDDDPLIIRTFEIACITKTMYKEGYYEDGESSGHFRTWKKDKKPILASAQFEVEGSRSASYEAEYVGKLLVYYLYVLTCTDPLDHYVTPPFSTTHIRNTKRRVKRKTKKMAAIERAKSYID